MAQVEKKRVALATRVALYLRQRPIACFTFALATGLVLGAVGLGILFAGGVARDGFASADGVEIRRDVDSDKGTDIDFGGTDETEADGAGADGETGDSLDAIIVDVAGAVTAPGVFELEAGARVGDAIAAAGGALGEADLSRVNRAARVSDGQQIYIPRVGEELSESVLAGGSSLGGGASTGDGDAGGSLVNINTAGEAELDELPGVGPSTARSIIEDRDANGPFATIEDLMRVSGIGEKKFEKLKSGICV
ncbi:ComEA family DNA-binding protein [Collinsella sp.]|uniref:ComEA family DNA-binding protein n=1 Tax=Collinsella sp. TaxID=1965294 RepID=UPI003FEFD6AE